MPYTAPLAASLFVVWTGLIYWPLQVVCVFTYADTTTETVRFERVPWEDQYTAITVDVDYTISKTGSGWDLDDDVATVVGLGDLFWQASSYDAAFASGAGRVDIQSYHTDWTRIDVLWYPVIMWLMTWCLLDLSLMTMTWPLRRTTYFLRREVPNL